MTEATIRSQYTDRGITEPSHAARFMAGYAKRFHAGAFAMPTRKDIDSLQTEGNWFERPGMMAVRKVLARESVRKDFTGREYSLPASHPIITHLAAEPTATLPDLSDVHSVYAYVEDTNLTHQLIAQGREVRAVRVSAASELIACWGLPGSEHLYLDHDRATVRLLGRPVSPAGLEALRKEIEGLTGWLDDFPFYSDGSWSALNLRGFRPDDPTWGIKPAEMDRKWKAEHPEAMRYECDWTTLASRTPRARELVERVFAGHELERVRLLQMAGRGGKVGRLGRHTDITDKSAGVANGQIARFHIPLITHPSITMTAWNLRGVSHAVHLPAGEMFYLDARKPHAVTNPSGIDRIHLVADVVSSPAIREIIREGQEFVK